MKIKKTKQKKFDSPRETKIKEAKKVKVPESKVSKVLKEFKTGTLHSGSKKGPIVKDSGQALAIALNYKPKKRKKK